MLYSLEHRFLFIHIQKNAGSSVHRALAPFSDNPRTDRLHRLLTHLHLDLDWHWHHFRGHASLRDAESVMPAEVFAGLHKFAIVRNPWERLVSRYHYQQQRRGHHLTKARVKQLSFSEFLRYAGDLHTSGRKPYSQRDMVVDASGQVAIDTILRLEQLHEDWDHLTRTLGLDAELPTMNRSKHRDYRGFYEDDDIAYVADVWRDDVETFGYVFE